MFKMLPDAYGCVVANRFGNLPDDDSDPLDLISEVESEKEKQKQKKKEENEKKGKQKKPGQKESQRDRRVPIATTTATMALPDVDAVRKQPPRAGDERVETKRGSKTAAFGERRANLGPFMYPQEFSVPKPFNDQDAEPRSRGGGRGRRGGSRGYIRSLDTFALRGKREYDRHNGTGISPDEKRGGRGPWNWGCVEEPTSELMEVIPDAHVQAEEAQAVAEDNQNIAAVEEEGDVVVQVAMEMTLDEWKALQEVSRPKADFNIRKAGNPIPSKAKVIHQSKHVEHLRENLAEMEEDGNFFRRSVNDITSLLDINFGSLGRRGRGRATRGAGPPGHPERAKLILEKVSDMAPDPDNPEDFPALSAGN
ncbi:intracellular hyaluronan-binding protein 4-like isoform X2 [Dunckerocampus dactyliophorus]|uniref:intracellular hyaluronan-binding protein 4-like isoform X2 n=1 Tax=Dunckerocampus dactyliophorus TaxID=161453 RepID=UPI002405FC7B|nr:intracellular hyaluronan-binding protein 4-like isoform X2 [Dunckerocampus dactyliophorus]